MNLSKCELIMSTIAQFFSVEDKVEIKVRAIVWICSIAINKFVIICNEMTILVSLKESNCIVFSCQNGEGSFDSNLLKCVSFP